MQRADLSIPRLKVCAPPPEEAAHPIKAEIARMVVELASDFAQPGSNLYELGCSQGSLLPALHEHLPPEVRFIGCDDSEDVLSTCRARLERAALSRSIDLLHVQLSRGLAIHDATFALMIGSSRVLRPPARAQVVRDVYAGLRDGAGLLVVDAVLGRDTLLNNLFATHGTRRLGRDLADDMLGLGRAGVQWATSLPSALAEERALLSDSGFRFVDIAFKWYGLCGFIAVK